MALFDTAGNIINAVASEVGLDTVADPYASSDPNMIQLAALLNAVGDELNQLFDWQQHRREGTITTVGSNPYTPPADFDRMIDQTQWSTDQNTPLGGPLNAQDWQYLVNSGVGASDFWVSFRIAEQSFYVMPETTTGDTLAYEYICTTWVEDSTDAGEFLVAPVRKNDIVRYHPVIAKRYLKVKWLEAKGLPSQRARDDLDLFFGVITGRNKGGRILNLTKNRAVPYLSGYNAPDVGYGS